MPASTTSYGLTGIASTDLGLGASLSDQAKDETEELRKKRMREMQDGGAGGGLAAFSLLGGYGARGA